MNVSIAVDIKNFTKELKGLQDKQMPFAISLAINNTLHAAKEEMQDSFRKHLDKPTKYTLNSILYKKSTKKKLNGRLYIEKSRLHYLQHHVNLKVRKPHKKRIAIGSAPWGSAKGKVRRNQYGNVPRGKIKKILEEPDVFSGEVHQIEGVWRRPKYGLRKDGKKGTIGRRKLQLLFVYKKRVKYKKKLPFYALAEASFKKFFLKELRKSYDSAIRSA